MRPRETDQQVIDSAKALTQGREEQKEKARKTKEAEDYFKRKRVKVNMNNTTRRDKGGIASVLAVLLLLFASAAGAHPFNYTGGPNCPAIQSPPLPGYWCSQVYENQDGDICCNSWSVPPEPAPHDHGFSYGVQGSGFNCYYLAAVAQARDDAEDKCPGGELEIFLDTIQINGTCVSKNICPGPDDVYDNYFTPSCLSPGRRRKESITISALCHVGR